MPPSIRYMNQSAPFWDFVAGMEDRVGEHPFFAGGSPAATAAAAGPSGAPPAGPHGYGPEAHFGPFGPGPHHHWGRHHGHGHGRFAHRGRRDRDEQQPPAEGEQQEASQNEKTDEDRAMGDDGVPDPPEDAPGNPPPGDEPHCGRGRRCGGSGERKGRGGGWGGRHRGWGHPYGGFPFHHMMNGAPRGGFGFLNEMFGGQADAAAEPNDDWKPEADVFDTESAFIIHVSLPGANKEDIGVSWDPEKSELSIAGVVHRPGDEALLKTLALDERKVGAFDRKVRLGTRSSPAQVDVEGITAKLENGILHVEVPKLNADFVEIKKVDIE